MLLHRYISDHVPRKGGTHTYNYRCMIRARYINLAVPQKMPELGIKAVEQFSNNLMVTASMQTALYIKVL